MFLGYVESLCNPGKPPDGVNCNFGYHCLQIRKVKLFKTKYYVVYFNDSFFHTLFQFNHRYMGFRDCDCGPYVNAFIYFLFENLLGNVTPGVKRNDFIFIVPLGLRK